MEFDFALAQDIGTRSEQQDSAAVCPFDRARGALFVIADGLGGHTGGARASHIAVKTFADAGESDSFKSPKDRFEQLGAALSTANDQIATAAQALAKNETMGTTLVAAAAAWNSIGWISVGDSHLYVWRTGILTKLNEDHSQAGQMVKSGRYKPDDPELDAYRSMLRSAIMGRDLTLIDRPIETKELEPGDIIVLATDGLNVVDIAEVGRLISHGAAGSAEAIANSLLDAVRAATVPSRDNATVIVARVLALDNEPGSLAGADPIANARGESEAAVTTAIVTTPFFKTARPGQNSSRANDVAPQKTLATDDASAKSSASVAALEAAPTAAPRRRSLAIWLALATVLAGGAALAFAYQRMLIRL
jgi:PPM family protein phosphatase